MREWIAGQRGEIQTRYLPYGYRKTPHPMTEPEESVVPIQVGEKGWSSRKWVGILAKLLTRSRHASSLLCTSVVSWTCLPSDLFGEFCNLVKITLGPATSRLMLRIIPRRLRHLRSDMVWAVLGMACSADSNLACPLVRRRSNYDMVSRFQSRTVFWMDQDPFPCPSFLREMCYFLSVSVSSLGQNNL